MAEWDPNGVFGIPPDLRGKPAGFETPELTEQDKAYYRSHGIAVPDKPLPQGYIHSTMGAKATISPKTIVTPPVKAAPPKTENPFAKFCLPTPAELSRKALPKPVQEAIGKLNKGGRPSKLTLAQEQDIITRKAAGEGVAVLARDYEVSRATVSKVWMDYCVKQAGFEGL